MNYAIRAVSERGRHSLSSDVAAIRANQQLAILQSSVLRLRQPRSGASSRTE